MGWIPFFCSNDCKCRRHNRQSKKHQQINESFNTYKYNASKKNREFKLNKDEFYEIITKNCYYCGSEPEKRTSRRYKIPMNGIDRIDSSKGYEKDNILPCCHTCNLLKGKLPKINFINHIRKIYEHTFEWKTI